MAAWVHTRPPKPRRRSARPRPRSPNSGPSSRALGLMCSSTGDRWTLSSGRPSSRRLRRPSMRPRPRRQRCRRRLLAPGSSPRNAKIAARRASGRRPVRTTPPPISHMRRLRVRSRHRLWRAPQPRLRSCRPQRRRPPSHCRAAGRNSQRKAATARQFVHLLSQPRTRNCRLRRRPQQRPAAVACILVRRDCSRLRLQLLHLIPASVASQFRRQNRRTRSHQRRSWPNRPTISRSLSAERSGTTRRSTSMLLWP